MERYGKLTILEIAYKKNNHYYYKCKCDCGNEKIIQYSSLISGDTKSCGCYKRKINKKLFSKVKDIKKIRLRNIWRGMKQRCYNKKDQHYINYGRKGIKICDEWLGEYGFRNFYKWAIENNYDDNLSIDRINVRGNYEPSNCSWVTDKEQ